MHVENMMSCTPSGTPLRSLISIARHAGGCEYVVIGCLVLASCRDQHFLFGPGVVQTSRNQRSADSVR